MENTESSIHFDSSDTGVVAKSANKDFHSRFIAQIKHSQFLNLFFSMSS